MIKSLEILNLQSHENSYLEFDPGVNCIIGNSDSGKTAILRAIRWAVWNRPSGNSIRSSWGGETSVLLETEDGSVCRFKGKTDKYELLKDGKSIVFKAFGTSVPEEISTFLNINEINLQQQLDSPFLLSETPGQVASHFNKVARLSKIDTGTINVNSWITKLKSDIGKDQTDIEKFTEQLKAFEHLEKFEIDIEVLETVEKRRNQLANSSYKLRVLIDDIYEITTVIEQVKEITQIEEPLNKILILIETKTKKIESKGKLENLINNIINIKNNITGKQSYINAEKSITNLLGLYIERNTAVNLKSNLVKLITSLNGIKDRSIIASQNHAKILSQYNFEFPAICPLCGKPK